MNTQWTGIEKLYECVEYKNEIELEADGLISGLTSLTDNIVSAYKGACGKSLPKYNKDDAAFTGEELTLNTALSNRLVSGRALTNREPRMLLVQHQSN